MKTFSIDTDNAVTAYASIADAKAAGATEIFVTAGDLAGLMAEWPMSRIVEVWNGIPGLVPVKRFENRQKAAKRIWYAVQGLTVPEPVKRAAVAPQPPGARLPRNTAGKKASKAASAATGNKGGTFGGSKKDQAIAMMRRAQGASNAELMEAFGWQTHTVRGFVAGTVSKKMGLSVESFKNAAGDRAYRIQEVK